VIEREFRVTSFASLDLAPRYNVCPGEKVAAIVERDGERRLGGILWGLGRRGQINVRSESLMARPTHREALRRRRCLVIADGFYEWRKQGAAKIPYFLRLSSHRPFGLAAIWEEAAAAILTCPANPQVAEIHDRMPVIFPAEACSAWLDCSIDDPAHLAPLLHPLPAKELEVYRVSTLVNSARNDSPECIRRVDGGFRLVEGTRG
jgi:putative SOS response-associated peptidase YedK